MPSFDVVSEVDHQEVRNAVDQVQRELRTRFDFKDTDSTCELEGNLIRLHAPTEDRLRAIRDVIEDKMVRRNVSLKALDWGKVEQAAGATVRQSITLQAGISSDRARQLNKFIKDLGLKGVQSQTQGDQLRVIGKKRDDLQAVIKALKDGDFGVPLQFTNFRE